MSFGGEDKEDKNSVEIREFHTKLEEFDELIKQNIVSKSKEWLGKPKVSMETVEDAYYVPSVKIPTDKDGNVLSYPSRVRVKLDRERELDSDNFTGRFLSSKKYKTPVLIFDNNKTQLDMNESNFDMVVPKGSQVVAVLELVYLSITSKISAKWKLVQAKVYKNQQSITGYAMLDEEEHQDDLDTENEVVEATKNLNVEEDVVDVEEELVEHEEDVEEEDVEEEVVEEEPEEVAPTPIKTKGRAKRSVQA